MEEMKYKDRTPESIKAEYDSITDNGVNHLAKVLQINIANEHNGRDFIGLLKEARQDGASNHIIMKQLLAHAYDWYAFGN